MDARSALLMVFCWVLGTLLSALHACLENTTGASLEFYARQEGRARILGARQAAIKSIVTDIPGHAHAVALVRILCNLGAAVASVFVVASVRARLEEGHAAPTLVDAAIGVLISAFVLWIFSVSAAESIGRHLPERFLYTFGPLARAMYLLQSPVAPVVHAIDAVVRKAAGAEHVTATEEVADEIMSVAEEGEREGLIDEEERRMIEAVVNFKHRTVEQIMTPRNEIEALEFTNNLGAITAFVRKVRHSRVPVFKVGGGLDDVIGFFYTKDLLRWLAGDSGSGSGAPMVRVGFAPTPQQSPNGPGIPAATNANTLAKPRGFDLNAILRPALHVPESKTIRELADEFVAKKVHAAVVVNEYGSVTGLVTLEDILEDVFGDIQDEYEKTEDEPRIEVRPDAEGVRAGLADMDARAYIGAANEALEPLGVHIPESDDYDTVGGFVLTTLGHMPEVNETFNHGRMTVTVLECTPTRVLKVRVHVHPEEEAPAPEAMEERVK